MLSKDINFLRLIKFRKVFKSSQDAKEQYVQIFSLKIINAVQLTPESEFPFWTDSTCFLNRFSTKGKIGNLTLTLI